MSRWMALVVLLWASTAHAQFSLRIGRAPIAEEAGGTPVSITSVILPLTSGIEGIVYTSGVITCEGGSGTGYTLTLTGSLPAGLSLNSAARTITGTPTLATSVGTAEFALTCDDDDDGSSGAQPASLSIGFGSPSITTSSLTSGTVDTAGCGGNTLASQGGKTPRTYSIASGALPTGCSLNSGTGAITGTPTVPGLFAVTYRVTDDLGGTGTRLLNLSISSIATGDCEGENEHDYFICLQNLHDPGTVDVQSNAMRSAANVLASGSNNTTPDSYRYLFATDPEPNARDAAKLILPAMSNSVATPLPTFDLDIDATEGSDVFAAWDEMHTKSWNVGRMACLAGGQSTGEKSNRFHASAVRLANSAPWIEIRDLAGGDNADDDGVLTGPEPAGIASGFSRPTGIPIASVTASGTTATVTVSGGNHNLDEGQTVAITGASTLKTIPITGCTTGTAPVCTTASPHGFTGTLEMQLSGEVPNITGSTPLDYFIGTVTGASTIQLQRPLSNAVNFTQAITSGNLLIYPYVTRSTAVHVTGATTFEYTLDCNISNCGGGSALASPATLNVNGAFVIPFRADGTMDEAKLRGGNHCVTVDVRRYVFSGKHAGGQYESDHLRGQINNYLYPCNTVVRKIAVIKLNQGAAWTCGADSSYTGNYDLFYFWIGDGNGGMVQIHNGTEVEIDRLEGTNPNTLLRENIQSGIGTGQCATHTNVFLGRSVVGMPGVQEATTNFLFDFRHERNTSSGGCTFGFSAPTTTYMWNQVLITTAAGGVSVPSASSVVIDSTEVLLPPVN